jgi:hypothetical protein
MGCSIVSGNTITCCGQVFSTHLDAVVRLRICADDVCHYRSGAGTARTIESESGVNEAQSDILQRHAFHANCYTERYLSCLNAVRDIPNSHEA